MNRTRITALALAAATLFAGLPAIAQNSSYWMRERIQGMPGPTYTYTPTYTPSSACVNSKKTFTLNGCKRSDGTNVATSFCGTAPKTKVESCTITYSCEPVVAGYYIRDASNFSYSSERVQTTAGWQNRAAAICQELLKGNPTANLCFTDTYQGGESSMSVAVARGSVSGPTSPVYYAASTCSVN